ncbi:hypothetical protein BJ165DRAFT_1469662 [Panaeolus papilionaceus]|nr:hypothetical protein BJ165DRAFT_1469662 [Panaeolus papilionaceus]
MKLTDCMEKAFYYARTQRPPRYLLIAFDTLIQFPLSEESLQALPVPSADRSIPEFKIKNIETTNLVIYIKHLPS